MKRLRADPWLLAILAASAVFGAWQLGWGLPNGNESWAADSVGPLSTLNIARKSLGSWNSGWFWYKYGFGYPLVLLISYAPYLGLLLLTGDLSHPSGKYPYGLNDPDGAIHALAMIGRWVSVLGMLGTVAVTCAIGRRLFGRVGGLLSAWFVATSYPVIYYAHTTNHDGLSLFWFTLSAWAALAAAESERRWPYVVFGVACAMALSTKEGVYSIAFALAAYIAVERWKRLGPSAGIGERFGHTVWSPGIRAGLVASVITVAVASNALVNPTGVMNRLRDLRGEPVAGMSSRLTPVEFSLFKGVAKETQYLRLLVDVVESSLGPVLFAVAIAGLVFLVGYRRRAVWFLLPPMILYYVLSLRAHDLLAVRYALPLVIVLALAAGGLCAAASAKGRVAEVAIGCLCVLGFARAVETDLILRNDPRYSAEEWMRANGRNGAIEVYQKAWAVPRFPKDRTRMIPLEGRTIEGVANRRPAFIVTSTAGKQAMTHRWKMDWRDTHTLLEPGKGAPELLAALETERLPYRRVARFSQHPWLIRNRITSLCPEITIYQRTES